MDRFGANSASGQERADWRDGRDGRDGRGRRHGEDGHRDRARPSTSTVNGAPLTVLVVGGDYTRTAQHALTLSSFYVVKLAHSVREAIAFLGTTIPEVVLVDLDLVDMPAVEFIRSLHRSEQTHDVLLLVVTTHSSIQEKIAAFEAGADTFLVEPVSPEALLLQVQLLSRFRRLRL